MELLDNVRNTRILLELKRTSYGEKLAFAAFAAYEAIRTLGGANDE